MGYLTLRRILVAAILVLGIVVYATIPGGAPDDPAAHRQVPAFSIPADGEGVSYERFIAVGDQGTGRDGQLDTAAVMATRVADDGVSFMVTLGDNFYPDGVTSVDDALWQSAFEDVYPRLGLAIPIFPSLGNHDHRGRIEAQVAYSARNPMWRMEDRFYTFTRVLADGTAIQFFALDTTPLHEGADDEQQLAWLQDELARSDARWKIVYGHHPLYSDGEHGDDPDLARQLEPILVAHGVDVFLAGHDHTLQLFRPIAGVYHVVSGAGGGLDPAHEVEWGDRVHYAATGGGFVIARLSRADLVLEFVRLDGATQFAHVISKE